MKRLIALLIAILTLLFGGVSPADETQGVPETETESVTELLAEKEKPDVATEIEVDPTKDITPSEPETIEDTTETEVEPADEPTQDTDTSFSQLTEDEAVPEEQTKMPEPTVQIEPPAVIPPTPVTVETAPPKTEEKTENTEPTDTAPSENTSFFIDPCQGGSNPFENAPPTEIEDHPVDKFIGDGDEDPEKASTSDHNHIHLPAAERDPCGFFSVG